MAATLSDFESVERLLVATALGAVLGLEREARGQAAGLRTHLLVALGSCLFTVASVLSVELAPPSAAARADLTRIASQVVVGIGFLGGGAILRHDTSVRGLTTAANLWLTASIGLAAGLGLFIEAVATTALALLVLAGLRPVERAIRRLRVRENLPTDRDVTSGDDGRQDG